MHTVETVQRPDLGARVRTVARTRVARPREVLHPIYVARESKEHALLQSLISPEEIAYFAARLVAEEGTQDVRLINHEGAPA